MDLVVGSENCQVTTVIEEMTGSGLDLVFLRRRCGPITRRLNVPVDLTTLKDSSLEDTLKTILSAWHQAQGSKASLGELVSALDNLGLAEVSARLRQKFVQD